MPREIASSQKNTHYLSTHSHIYLHTDLLDMDPVLANLVSTQTNLNNEMNQLKVNIATYDLMINELRQNLKNINKFQLGIQ